MTIDLDELERLAKAAAEDIDPGNVFASPWWTADYLADHELHMSITDAAFIEKASPQVVLELVAEVRRPNEQCEIWMRKRDRAYEERDAALAQLDSDRPSLAIAIRELKERRNNYHSAQLRAVVAGAYAEVINSYDATIAEIDGAIAVLERLRGAT